MNNENEFILQFLVFTTGGLDKSSPHKRLTRSSRVDYFLSNCYSFATYAEGIMGCARPFVF
jgi:hypothetical protein